MQQIARDNLTEAQVRYIIQDSPDLSMEAGAELLDLDLNVIEDISNDLLDGEVRRSNYATLHGSASLQLSRELSWGRAIVRPYTTLSDGRNAARFNLGAYFTNTPARALGSKPLVFDVDCYDLLHALATPTGESYSVAAGESYLSAVESILVQQGFTRYLIDPSRSTVTLPSAKVWPLDENTTWLVVVNDLLLAIGYRGIWTDWDGVIRCEAYTNSAERNVEWTYDAGQFTSMLAPNRLVTRDFYSAPNRWVVIRNNNVEGSTPVEGDGIYTYVNEFEGETSVEARNGRTITRILKVDAADQTALIARAQEAIESDTITPQYIEAETAPNPLHWHFDKLLINDPEIGINVAVLESEWTLPLLGPMMAHKWSVL